MVSNTGALCPPSFSLYLYINNDMGREISEGIEGAVTGDRVNCVSHMLYADDFGLTTNDPGEMQTMLNKLRTYAEKKGRIECKHGQVGGGSFL